MARKLGVLRKKGFQKGRKLFFAIYSFCNFNIFGQFAYLHIFA